MSSNNSNNNNNNSKDENHKKRKVWRTVNVSAGGGPPQAMTPEAAAKYIQQATASRGREVKISFGPSRPGPSVSFGSLDLNALKETAAAAAAAKPDGSSGGNSGSGSNSSNNKGGKKDGLPCSEAEMKALMSMFVEIMGMSMDTDKLKSKTVNNNASSIISNNSSSNSNASNSDSNNNSNNKKKGPMFMFGNSNVPPGWSDSESMAAATAGFFADGASWEAIRRTYGGTGDDEDDDSMPDLDDMREMFSKVNPNMKPQALMPDSKMMAAAAAAAGIAPDEWESLEQVAIDDALESQDRARKASKKKDKKHRKKLKQKEEAAQKAAEAGQKKREKAILSWRSRVVSACQSSELSKLEALLQESPLRKQEDEKLTRSWTTSHLEFLLPNCIAKNRSQLERGKEVRHRLATYVLTTDIPIAFTPLRTGRTALHTACFHGDLPFVQLVLEKLAEYDDTDSLLPESCLNTTCDDSGWAPLHYAAVSGSIEILEVVLAGGCNVTTITDDTHTWRESDGGGITARELVQCVHNGSYEKVLESHGVALQEMQHVFFGNPQERRLFLKTLDRVFKRLADVEQNGYSPPDVERVLATAESEESTQELTQAAPQQESAAARKRKKKKKKKQAQKESAETTKSSTASVISAQSSLGAEKQEEEDPLVTALLGMGFTNDQISDAVKACGGTNRATADDLVMFILGQDADGGNEQPSETQQPEEVEVNENTMVKTKVVDEAKKAAEEDRQREEAAQRLAAKREEKRRRNREWNNREQARQQEQAKAKITQALDMDTPHPEVEAPPPGYAASFPSLEGTAPKTELYTGMPNGLHPGTGLQTGLQTGLAEPSKPPPQSQPVQPLVVAPAIPVAQQAPRAASPVPPQTLPNLSAVSQFPSLSHSVMPSHFVASSVPAALSYNAFPPIGDDERTVSSFGSNPSLSVASNSFLPSFAPTPVAHVPNMGMGMPPPGPPGFRPSSVGPAATAKPPPPQSRIVPGVQEEPNESGEIRATAKAFIPSTFTRSAGPPPPTSSSLPSLSSNFAAPPGSRLGVPLSDVPPTVMGAFDNAAAFPAGLLQPGVTRSSLLGPALGNDRVPSVTPVSEDSSSPLGIPLGFGSAEPQAGAGTASLLTSAFTNGPPIGGSSIWGGSSQVVPPSLGNLPPLSSFGEDNREKGVDPQHLGRPSANWAAPGGGGNMTSGGPGSIW